MSPEPSSMPLAADVRVPHVAVLISLYKGKAFLEEQIESIARQRGVRVSLIGRDDGSPDDTGDFFAQACTRHAVDFTLMRGPNMGASNSFLELILQADIGDADFVALCDQDDVWLEDKLIRAATILAAHDGVPGLYCSGHELTDGELVPIGPSPHPGPPSFGNSLITNIVQGATALVNRPGLALLRRVGKPRHAVMHDWWCYQVFAALGVVVYDHYASLLYRQHGANVVGSTHSFFKKWNNRIRRYFTRPSGVLFTQAAELEELVGPLLPPEKKHQLQRFLASKRSLGSRLALLADRSIRRNSVLDDAAWRLIILVGRY